MPPPETFFLPPWLRTCVVRILVVTDSASGGFDDTSGFHLGQVLGVLSADPWPHVRFEVTKAHRQVTGAADMLDNFRFDAHDLTQYSQIWLFGINSFEDALTPAELRAVTQFMDGGGGVFATGDHQDLGRPMCGEVPRVRSMRRWYWPAPGPNGEPVAPDQVGAGRNDTVMDLGLGGSQSDDEPQPIRPRRYTRLFGGGIISRVHTYPHPVLCGKMGVIDYLPDHMHEGLCEVPANLGKSWTFDGYTSPEYPTVGGVQQPPEVIAWATTRNTDGHEFGVLAAYDGHPMNVGRVIVDATWHHWFNINLLGFVSSTDPLVMARWEEIKAYYRNVALWLARPGMQTCLRNGGWLLVSRYYDILITFRPLDHVVKPLEYYWQLGVFARDAMGRVASQCERVRWLLELVRWEEIWIDPWHGRPPIADPLPWLDLDDFENVVAGGAIHELMTAVGGREDATRRLERNDDDVDALLRRGAIRGAAEFLRRYEDAGRQAAELRARLSERR